MTLMEKSFKELSEMTEEVANRFFMAQRALKVLSNKNCINKSELPYEAYLKIVENAYRSLDAKGRNLINNEFFFQNYHDWWIGLYSKTSFYRFKRKAMLKFLEAFYRA